LEMLDRRCISDARRHRTTGAKSLFRSKMLEHRRIQGQMTQLQRFKENAMAQFDALSNHELNRTFVRTMKGMVGANKDRVTETREDADKVMEDLQDSLSQVKDLTEFLGQPLASVDEISDGELELEFLEETKADTVVDGKTDDDISIAPVREVSKPPALVSNNRIEDLIAIRPMLPSY